MAKSADRPLKALPTATAVVSGAAEVLTCAADATDLVGLHRGGEIAIVGNHIAAIGSRSELQKLCDLSTAKNIDAAGGIAIPGFVDCHTHLVFAGSRVAEYAARVSGAGSEQIVARGIPAGIPATVQMLRDASTEQLERDALSRLDHMLRYGTTTVEAKSGYGLSTQEECRILKVQSALQRQHPIEVISTFLGAHDLPKDRTREAYIDEIIFDQIPRVVEATLAEFNDVYCDEGYFTVEESRRILEAGSELGLKVKIHTDAYSHIGGSRLAADLEAISADHLNYTAPDEYELLRNAGVVGVVMPGLDFSVGHSQPFNARAMMDTGMTLALATDMCPGCWLESMPFVIQLACRSYTFSVAEAVRAATYGAALAVGRGDEIGSLEIGKRADIAIFNLSRYEDLAYRLGRSEAEMVIADGQIVYHRNAYT